MSLLGKLGVFLVSFPAVLLTAVWLYDLLRAVSCGWLLAPFSRAYSIWCVFISWDFRPDIMILTFFTLLLWVLFLMQFVTKISRFKLVVCVWVLCLFLYFVTIATKPLWLDLW